ncbi:Phosphate ABC transporter, periplasmic phosphate-binding protein PstS [Alkalibacterium sp. AK22]|uniref:substrate-binding domain-containing protein n=1 Tax=Alkalibacterium sp. AK22 TaxID=1229520 RepID=UPI00044D55AC|nr:substrate-binding domain-containing protein [Alkalibacterium sp. AK22]EXJ24459.1 Phosphate ABC transporter, periplasmic phosphate-binding protein PstS [Alkalibacterium sp. AK22]
MKRNLKMLSVIGLAATTLIACADTESEGAQNGEAGGDFDTSSNVHVVTREMGSGTRDAFAEMTGLDDGDNDLIDPGATAQQGTNAVNSTVADDLYAIGYTSIGAVDDSLKAISADGVDATEENILDGDYEIARNFNVIIGEELSEVADDFWTFMFSEEGQAIVAEVGYISAETDAPAYEGHDLDLSGSIDVNGSTSVFPVVEAIAEAYMEIHPDVQIATHSTGSGAGVTSAIEGTSDIGMASRELNDDELGEVTESRAVAVDGIAVVTHPDNPLDNLTMEQIADIFRGDVSTWDELLDN